MEGDIHRIHGLWERTRCQHGRDIRSMEAVLTMSKRAFLVGQHSPGWDGLWAEVTYGYEGGAWSVAEVLAACRDRILVGVGLAPRPDLYIWAGGRFRATLGPVFVGMEMQQFFDGRELGFPTEQLAIVEVIGDRMRLSVADIGDPRPSGFEGECAELVSCEDLVRLPGSAVACTGASCDL